MIGVLLAYGAVLTSMLLEGSSPLAILQPPALVLIFLATTGAAMSGNTIAGTLGSIKWLAASMTARKPDMEAVIQPLVKMAERARREGLLALESELDTIEDPFMRKGLQMAVDGTDPDDLFEILSAEVRSKKAAVAQGAGFWADAGGYSPTIGIIGTVIGMIHVLENLSEPATLGPLIAGAFVATLWGVLSANVMFLPWAKRIRTIGLAEASRMEIIIDGVLAIQAGANPRVVATKLKSKMVHAGPVTPDEEAA
ncbi:MAG TPA: MotA/TolQ/ExbB proton channel family protein [Kineosporiaceae bacterium]